MSNNPKISSRARYIAAALASTASFITLLPNAATAQDRSASVTDIVVTARREAENLQDVPVSVQVVTGDAVQKLAITSPAEISKLTPGLNITVSSPQDPVIILRGVRWTQSGGTPAIPIYLNEISFDPVQVLQTLYDVGQIEVLRGPQGTTRGAPSISGAVTITSRKPDTTTWGGYGQVQIGSHNHWNYQGALNIPVVPDVLAIRVAGNYDTSEANRVRSVNSFEDPELNSLSGRVSLRFTPTDTLKIDAMFQRLEQRSKFFTQVVGTGSPGVPALGIPANYNGPALSVDDYRGVSEIPNGNHLDSNLLTVNASWEILGQQLSYNFGSQYTQSSTFAVVDPGNALVGYDRTSNNVPADKNNKYHIHEIRLSSIRGGDRFFDYDLGFYSQQFHGRINFASVGAFLNGAFGNTFTGLPSPFVNRSIVDRYTLTADTQIYLATHNRSFYGNAELHLPYDIEVSGGVRFIRDRRPTSIAPVTNPAFALATPNLGAGFGLTCPMLPVPPGTTLVDSPNYPGFCDAAVPSMTLPVEAYGKKYTPTIWNASVSKKFGQDLLVYATAGTSWRAGLPAINNPGLPSNLLFPNPEKATSYEVGVKSTWGRHFRVNADVFQIDYKGQLTQFRGISYFNSVSGSLSQTGIQFLYNVDARVRGVELEVGVDPIRNLSLNGSLSYAKIESQGGSVPCNDASRALNASNPINFCPSAKGETLNAAPPFQASLNGSYSVPLGFADGYLRFVVNHQGHNTNFGTSEVDTKAYTIVDLFAGLTGQEGGWDVGVYAKNVFNKKILLTSNNIVTGFGVDEQFGSTGYSSATATLPREVGVTLRYAFGSR